MIVKITLDNESLISNSFISENMIKKELENNPFANFLGYTLDNKIVGYLYYSNIYDRIEINQIEVQKEYRNQKIATKLMQELIKENKDITLEVKKTNTIAIKLYQKFDFKEIAIRKGYYNGIDALLMERKIIK